MANVKYKYACTEEDVLVCIDDILPEQRKSHKYYCLSCGHELLPRALKSEKRSRHFYHKEEVECSGETYLHKLAKKLIKAKFDSRHPFSIKYPRTIECEQDSCNLVDEKCTQYEDYVLNLYDYYDTCTEETSCGGFVADLLLTNSQKKDRQPLFIEIFVTHQCEKKKIESGIKAIEVYIKNEASVIKFVEKEIIDINEPQQDCRFPYDISLYSFKRIIKRFLNKNISRFVFNPPYTIDGYITQVDCSQALHRIRKNSIVELNILENWDSDRYFCLKWLYKNKNIRRCDICIYYYSTQIESKAICRLSKKYTEFKPNPRMDDAERCRAFRLRENDFLLEGPKILPVTDNQRCAKDEYIVIIASSFGFYNYDLAKEKCDFFLQDKKQTHDIIIITDLCCHDILAKEYANDCQYKTEPHKPDWIHYGNFAAYERDVHICKFANELIVFGDLTEQRIVNLIDAAQKSNLKIEKVFAETNPKLDIHGKVKVCGKCERIECEQFHLEDFTTKSTSSVPSNIPSPPVIVESEKFSSFNQQEVNTHSIDRQQRSCFNCKNHNWFQDAYGMVACKDWQKFNLEHLINPDYALECYHFESMYLDNIIPDKAIPQPELIKAIYPECAWQSKRSKPASFPCCPTQIGDRAIEDYYDKLYIGGVYCEIALGGGAKQYHKIIDKACVDDNKIFFVISKNEDVYKKFGLHKVYLLDDKFIHENIGQYFEEQGARKKLADTQGWEWSDTDTIDDFFKF